VVKGKDEGVDMIVAAVAVAMVVAVATGVVAAATEAEEVDEGDNPSNTAEILLGTVRMSTRRLSRI